MAILRYRFHMFTYFQHDKTYNNLCDHIGSHLIHGWCVIDENHAAPNRKSYVYLKYIEQYTTNREDIDIQLQEDMLSLFSPAVHYFKVVFSFADALIQNHMDFNNFDIYLLWFSA